jgi:superfamily II DNA/RNA helicase
LPTRELSIQVHQYLKQIINASAEIKALPEEKQFKSTLKGLSSLLTIGGIPIEDDKKTLMSSGANFIVGTVGKIYQLIESGCLKTHSLQYVIFD